MIDTNTLFSIAEKENIDIFDYSFNDNINGVFVEQLRAIGLKPVLNDIERKCTLAEELGHYYCNATYPLSCTDKTLIDKAEYRAKKWSAKYLISPSDIQRAKLCGLKQKWEIADFLGVTEDVIERAFALQHIA